MKNLIIVICALLFGFNAWAIKLTRIERESKVNKVVTKNFNEIKNCYEKRLDEGLKGKAEVNISWQIDDKGLSKDFKRSTVKPGDEKLYKCLIKKIGIFKFEAAPAGQSFEIEEYPFVISSEQ